MVLNSTLNLSGRFAYPHLTKFSFVRLVRSGTFSWHIVMSLVLSLQPAHEKIGVVDSQWIVHQVIPSLGSQVSHQ
jgi:hypothetical protein